MIVFYINLKKVIGKLIVWPLNFLSFSFCVFLNGLFILKVQVGAIDEQKKSN